MWTSWLRAIDDSEDALVLAEPVGAGVLADVEDRLELTLPEDLRSLLVETDGVVDTRGGEPVWPAERIAEENLGLRNTGSTPALPDGADEDLLFFGDAGSEDLFVYELDEDGDVTEPDIYVWDAAQSEARWVASDLQSLLDDWFSGNFEL